MSALQRSLGGADPTGCRTPRSRRVLDGPRERAEREATLVSLSTAPPKAYLEHAPTSASSARRSRCFRNRCLSQDAWGRDGTVPAWPSSYPVPLPRPAVGKWVEARYLAEEGLR
jgi:hypothetical protein